MATPELRDKLDPLQQAAGKPRSLCAPAHARQRRHQPWLDQLQQSEKLRSWVLAVIATAGLRGLEMWHLKRLSGELVA